MDAYLSRMALNGTTERVLPWFRDRRIFFCLCAWAGINIGLFFDIVVGRQPSVTEMAVSSLAISVFILRVTLPFVQEYGLLYDENEAEVVNS